MTIELHFVDAYYALVATDSGIVLDQPVQDSTQTFVVLCHRTTVDEDVVQDTDAAIQAVEDLPDDLMKC